MIAYENLSNISKDDAVAKAERVLSGGWALSSYPPVVLKAGAVPWALRDLQHRSWNFHVHSWDMIDVLLMAHSTGGSGRFLSPAIEIALDWHHCHQVEAEQASPFAWYDMAVGLRAYRLAYLLDAAEVAGLLTEEQHAQLWTLLKQHQEYLGNDDNIVFHNNHGFYQAAGQLAMGRRFSDRSGVMQMALEQGRERLLKMLHAQFAADGVHLEHSPDYHRMVYTTLRGVLDAGLIDDPVIMAFAERIESALYWFVQPNQRLANFGDSDYRSVAARPDKALKKWRTGAMRFAASGGQCGAPPDQSMAAFEDGGYFVVKTPLKSERDASASWGYLAQQAAFHSRTHKHADNLSLIWHDHGQDILVDSGRYGYLGKAEQGSDTWKDGHWYSDPKRVYCESTRAHNTVEFDQKNHPRKGIKPPGSMIGRHALGESGVYMLETEARHFRGLRHARVLFYLPGKWLLVYDWFKDSLGTKHGARQWFHLAPNLVTEVEEQGYQVNIPGVSKPLKIRLCLPGSVAMPISRGQSEPGFQGWWSGSERELVPSDAFGFEHADVTQGQLATLFSFSDQIECDTRGSKVAPSGRNGVFCWRDDNHNHRLDFNRKAGGSLSVTYTDQSPSGGIKAIARRLVLRK